MKERYQGSITIFSLLSMLLVAATLLSLLEGARFWEIKRLSDLQTRLAVESMFANYSTELWGEYRLLACNQGEMEEILIRHANGRYASDEDSLNALLFQVREVDICSYTLLTDGEGAAYVAAVSSYMQDNLLYETAKELYSRYEAVEKLQESTELDLSDIDDALESMEEESQESSHRARHISRTGDTENPLEAIQSLMGAGLMELVIEDTDKVSKTTLDMEQAVSKRQLDRGKNPTYAESGWWEKILLQQYVLTYMSNFCDFKENHFLDYEVEYLIGGKSSDKENMKIVISQLLFIREIANFLYLTTDVSKVSAAEGLALTLVGLSANPILIETVKVGLLTAWAFAESVLDVRALLQGKRIPLLKSEESWTLEIENIASIGEGYSSAKNSKWGLTYKEYLGILLLFQEENTIAMRAMDVQEATIRQKGENPDFKMDQLIVKCFAEITYDYAPLFYALEEIIPEKGWKYETSSRVEYGYN